MKTRTHLSKSILCSLLAILCMFAFAACIRYVGCLHEWGDWTVQDATCQATGTKTRTCTLCGEQETVTIDQLPHAWAEATCTAAKTCTACGATEGDAMPHSYTEQVINDKTLKAAATCTSPTVYYKSCTCGHISENDADTFLYGDKLPHVYNCNVPKADALKSEATEDSAAVYYKSCVCGKVSPNEDDVFSHEHSYVDQIVAPTCLEQGYTLHTCACGDSYKDTYTSADHNWLDATCTAPKSCDVCGLTEGDALGHIGDTATCTAKAICTRCSMAYGDTVAHDFTAEIADDMTTLAKDATCDSAAEYYYSCSVCGKYNDAEGAPTFPNGAALAHVYAWTSNGDGTHTGTCQNQGCQHTISGNCSGGTATCTQQAICEVCLEYYGEALGHAWVDSDTAVLSGEAATCTTAGKKQQICANDGCDAVTTVTVPAFGHNYTADVTQPTCNTAGYTTYTCQNEGCNHSYEADYIINNHNWNIEAPTCTEAQVCSVCGETNEATGHNYVLTASTNATCTQAATKTYQCSSCGDSYTETVGTPTAHNTVGAEAELVAVVGAKKCLFIEHYACSDCGTDVVGDQVEKHGKYAATIQTAATCQTEGVKILTCSDCGESKTESIPVDSTLGHAWIEGVATNGKRTDTCSLCGQTKSVTVITENQPNKAEDLKDTELSIGDANINFGSAADSIGQQTQNDITIGAGTLTEDEKNDIGLDDELLGQIGNNPIYNFTVTDTEDNRITNFGEDTYVTISLPYELAPGEDVDSIAIWFINDQGEVESIKATYNNGYVTFQTNHFSYYTVTRLTPAQRCELYGHNFKQGTPVAATCLENGYVLNYCIRCRYSEKIEQEGTITGHSYVSVTVSAATCTTNGSIKHTCSTCQSFYTEVVPALKHSYTLISETAATCTTVGSKVEKCLKCHIQKTTQIPVLEHNCEATQIVAPTCVAQGYTVYACRAEGCTYSYTGNYVNPIGHKYAAVWSWAEDYSNATVTLSCQNAGCQYNSTPITENVESTCTVFDSDTQKEGRKEFVVHFTFDGQTFSDQKNEIIPVKTHDHSNCEWQYNKHNHWYKCSEWKGNSQKLPHEFDDGVITKAATCKSEGEITYTCICGYQKTEIIPRGNAHTSGSEIYRDAGTHWYICTECNEKCNEAEHVWGNGTVTKAATCTEKGLMTYRCVCGAITAEEIAATGHTIAVLPGREVTCTRPGLTEGSHCSACGLIEIEQTEIPPVGHTVVTLPGREATCTTSGLTTGSHCSACGLIEIEQTEIPPTGHTVATIAPIEVSCTYPGYTEGTFCVTCELVIVEQIEIPATGHNYQNGVCIYCETVDTPIEHQHVFDNACDAICNECGATREVSNHRFVNGICTYCGETKPGTDAPHEHELIDGMCECGFIPVFENASVYDNDGDGENDVYYFTPILPDQFQGEDVVHVWAGTNESPQGSFNSATFNIPHWYCIEGMGHYLLYTVEVPEAGIYEMAVHMRMKDDKERGAKYTVNEGTDYEYSFETSFQFATQEDVYAARENDYTMSSYMFGIYVELQAGTNTIKIQDSSKSPKNQHFRDFYFVLVDDNGSCAHTYVETERQAATCTTGGYVIQTCSLCQKTKTVRLQATGHTWDAGITIQTPTCTIEGVVHRTCLNCSAATDVYIPAIGHYFEGSVCKNCGSDASDCDHEFVDGMCWLCGLIPVYENASVYDNDGDGENDIYYFTPLLPEQFQGEDVVHVWAGTNESPQGCFSTATFSEIKHWYCTEGKGHYLLYTVEVAEAGIYEMAVHMRMKDDKERGAKYTVNEGTDYEYSFETSFQFATQEDAYAARENDYTMSSYMFGIYVELQAGTNTIKIQDSSKSPKNQHFRDFYFILVDGNGSCAHTYVETERQEATCTSNGYITKVCSLCGKVRTTTISRKAHTIETTFDMQGTSCTDGYYIVETCTVCGNVSRSIRYTTHKSTTVLQYNFKDYGATGGYLRVNKCACGYTNNVSYSSCGHGYTSTSNQYTDEQGIRWYVETKTSTCDCAIRYDRAYYYTDDKQNCTRITNYEISLVVGNNLVATYQYSTTDAAYHDYAVTATLAQGATDCSGGVTLTYTCRNCGDSYEQTTKSHITYEKERIDLAQYGSACGGYLTITGCVCGYSVSWSVNECHCEFDQRSTNDWITGDINGSQQTAQGSNSFYTDSYTYTCSVTSPTQCGFVIRYTTYWLKNGDCSATKYLTVQIGYDANTGTCAQEKTFTLSNRKTYHNYQSSSIEGGTKYLCSDCGSYYTSCTYYNENGSRIKRQTIYVNTLDDGNYKYREDTYEYYQNVDSRWNGKTKMQLYKVIYADNTEYWYTYDYTYADYAAPFGENGYIKREVYTVSSGTTSTTENAYTSYQGYQFQIYEHYTSGSTWRNYDYTYSFENGCTRVRTYTNSSGTNRVTTESAHPSRSYETVKAPTCTQYGVYAYRCRLCDHLEDEQSIQPNSHNWVRISDDLYYCYNCGLQNINGATGDIVMEDLTEQYGNGSAYVIGYWMNTAVSFTPHVTIYLHTPIEIDGVLEDVFVLYLTDEQFYFVTDEYVGLYVTVADIQAAVAALCQDYGIAAFTSDMYAVSISFVPDGADGNFDYAITFDYLPGGENIDRVIKDDAFLTDYIPEGGNVEYTITPDETADWIFTSYANADTYAYLLDATGKQLTYNDDGGEGNNFLISYTLQAGKTYILRVRWYSGSNAGYMGVFCNKGE